MNRRAAANRVVRNPGDSGVNEVAQNLGLEEANAAEQSDGEPDDGCVGVGDT